MLICRPYRLAGLPPDDFLGTVIFGVKSDSNEATSRLYNVERFFFGGIFSSSAVFGAPDDDVELFSDILL